MSKNSADYTIDKAVWEDILRVSRQEVDDIKRLEGSFHDNMRRIVTKQFAERFPNQNGVYELEGIDTEFIKRIAIYYGDVVIQGVFSSLSERGFTLPGIDVKSFNRRLYYIVLDSDTFNNVGRAEDLLDYIDEFLYNNIPHAYMYEDEEGEIDSDAKLNRIKRMCNNVEEEVEYLMRFDTRFTAGTLPRLVSDITIAGEDIVTREKFELVRRALCLYYSLFYDTKPYSTNSLNIGGEIYDFTYLGLPIVSEIVYDISMFGNGVNQCAPFCEGLDEYNYVDFTNDNLAGLINMSEIREESYTYSLPSERLSLFHKVWSEVLAIKEQGKIPTLCFSSEMQPLEKFITVAMIILEDVRVGIEPRGDIGRILAEYSRMSKLCNCLAEDRLRYLIDSVDSFFTFSNRELWFGMLVPNGAGTHVYHTAPISIGYVEIEEDRINNGYRIVSDKEETINFDLINDANAMVIMSYKDLNMITLEDSFSGMPGKEGRSFCVSERSNRVLCNLFEQYEDIIDGVVYDSPFEKSLRPDEFLSLRNCFFMLYNGKLCVARIMELENKMDVMHSRFIYWAKMYAGEITEDELNQRQIVEKGINEDNMYKTCLPLMMLADYDGLGSTLPVEGPNGEESELRMRIKPYVNTDGIAGCLLLMHNTGKYTQQIQEDLRRSKKLGFDAVALGKFDINSNLVFKTDVDLNLFKYLTRKQLRRMGYFTCYGGDNLVWKDGYTISSDTFKR